MCDCLFSIITPVYNRQASIGVAIDSMLAQTYLNWELLLVDDGSTDETATICKEYAQRDERIRYMYKENGGVSSARNRGLSEAKGDYILFLDSDDCFKPQTLSVLQEHVIAHRETDFFCFGIDTRRGAWLPQDEQKRTVIDHQSIREQYLPTHINIYPQTEHFLENYVWNKCFSAAFLRANNMRFDETRRNQEDGIFVVNCLDAAKELVLVGEALIQGGKIAVTDHLSAKLYKDQLISYVSDETAFQKRFAGEYDFTTEHYCRSNFHVFDILCTRTVREYGKQAQPILETVMKEPVIKGWAARVVPADTHEKQLAALIMSGKADDVYALYHPPLYKRILRKIRRMIKR